MVEGYLGRPATMPAALAGVERMYLAPLIRTNAETCRMAAAAGVRHIVDMAGAKGDHWQEIEDGVEACGVPWTHLEPGEFMHNADLWAGQVAAGDVVRDYGGEAANAPIALEDIAAVAARVLLEDGHEGRSYPLTGPESITRRERVRLIGAAQGRDLEYVDLPRAEAVAQFAQGMGEYAEWYLDGVDQLIAHPQLVDPTLATLLDRPPITFAEWARQHADLFRPAENADR